MESVHIHVHSEYTLLSSMCRIPALVEKAKAAQFSALALTDRHVMYGAVPFYKACKESGLKPIIGMETTVRFAEDRESDLLLYARSNKGYEHLLKLSTIIQCREEKEKYVTWEELLAYKDDLLYVIPYSGGFVRACLEDEALERGERFIQFLKDHLGGESVYLEIQGTDRSKVEPINQLAAKLAIPLVCSQHIQVLEREDLDAWKVIQAIREGVLVEELRIEQEEDVCFFTLTEMEQTFRAYPEALQNTKKLADRCHVELTLGKPRLPKFQTPNEQSAEDYLRKLCEQGAKERYGEEWTKEKAQRLGEELAVIERMGFSDYFLIVWDFMRFAREASIVTGPGRGSVAGSLVAYVLFITDVDPLHYDLLFERFLNPERISLPDIDLDFPDHRREEVIVYVKKKYGANRVAQILTFGTLAARASVRDVGKALAIPPNVIEKISKEISGRPGMTLVKAYNENERLRQLVHASDEAQKVMKLARKVEGLPRHTSTHAAGVVISEQPLTEVIALQHGQGEVPLTQGTMETVEDVGLIKMDFLGLRNLTLLEMVVKRVRETYGHSLNVKQLPLNDAKTFALLAKGETTGVFQLESGGMRKVLRELKPNTFADIVAVNALYRPGPMEFIPDYIQGKEGTKEITYLHPDLEPILSSTYGVIVYQEQIMQIAAKMAGFSLGEADLLRRAISKKKGEALRQQEEAFVTGAVRQGYEQETAKKIYELIVRFANYGFNKSHAVAYSMLAYQLAYLKAHYPSSFYAALASAIWNQPEKLERLLQEMKQQGIRVLPPSLSKSDIHFSEEEEGVRFPLLPLRYVSVRAIRELIKARREAPVRSLFDLCSRVDGRIVTSRVMESLIKAGALDELGERATLLANIEEAFQFAEQVKEFQENTGGLFQLSVEEPEYIKVEPLTDLEKLAYEKEAVGFYLSGHPLLAYTESLRQYDRLTYLEGAERRFVKLAGMIHRIRRIRTKRGEVMGFLTMSDETGEWEAVVFPAVWAMYEWGLKEGELYFVEGKMDRGRSEELQLLVDKVLPLKHMLKKEKEKLFLKITADVEKEVERLNDIRRLLQVHHGPTPVVMYYEKQRKTIQLPEKYHVSLSFILLHELEQLVGKEHVVVSTYEDES